MGIEELCAISVYHLRTIYQNDMLNICPQIEKWLRIKRLRQKQDLSSWDCYLWWMVVCSIGITMLNKIFYTYDI